MQCIIDDDFARYDREMCEQERLEQAIQAYADELIEQYRSNKQGRYITTIEGKICRNPDLPFIVDVIEESISDNELYWKSIQKRDWDVVDALIEAVAHNYAAQNIDEYLDNY